MSNAYTILGAPLPVLQRSRERAGRKKNRRKGFMAVVVVVREEEEKKEYRS